ncbi:Wzz/FepE/Etk N-terminal domain-containing protein [Deferribacter thermophilus]|uniref:Wzz/FepE/Etk N-terminal domain-containing protein n=1 Tax=Deferribacter thermophilus TaxID=53573 RepID=UPI003C1EEFCB
MDKNIKYQPDYFVEEDEIDLIELFAVIWRRKIMIGAIVLIASILSVIITINMDNIYESKAVLKPTASDSSKLSSLMGSLGGLASLAGISVGGESENIYNAMQNLLNNQEFIANIIKKYHFEKKIFEDDYDELINDEEFKQNYKYFVYKKVSDMISINQDKKSNYITLSVQHKDPAFAKKFVEILLSELSEKIKQTELENIDEKITNFKQEMEKTSDITLKTKLAEVISSLIQSKVISKAQKYYGFTIISEPYVPDIKDKVKPKRALICIVAFVTSFFMAIFLAFFLEFIKNIPEEKKKILKGESNA